MSANGDDHRHADLRRRLDALEAEGDRLAADLARVRDDHPTYKYMESRLATVQTQHDALARQLGALERDVGGLSGRIDRFRDDVDTRFERWRDARAAESSTRRSAWLAAGLALLVTIAGAVFLAGIGAIGGG